jgi:hypothetical protein
MGIHPLPPPPLMPHFSPLKLLNLEITKMDKHLIVV